MRAVTGANRVRLVLQSLRESGCVEVADQDRSKQLSQYLVATLTRDAIRDSILLCYSVQYHGRGDQLFTVDDHVEHVYIKNKQAQNFRVDTAPRTK